MKRWKRSEWILLGIGGLAIGYWILIKLLYGYLSFDLIFLLGGLCLVAYAVMMHHHGWTLQELLPQWMYHGLMVLLVVGTGIFALVEGRIIYDGWNVDEGQGDVILVLGAGLVRGDQVSKSLAFRLETAVEEHKKHPETPIIVSGGQGADESVSEAYAMKQWLVAHGVKEAIIWMEDASTNTSENFTFSMELMKKQGITSNKVTLITNRFHMHRAKYLGKHQGLDLYGRPAKELFAAKICFYTREFFGMMRAYVLQE